MNANSQLEVALGNEGLDEAMIAKVLAIGRPGILIRKRYETLALEQLPLLGFIKRKPKTSRLGLAVTPGASYVGGLPELPPDYVWPSVDCKPLQFLAQINCSEIATYRDHTLLPPTGMLHFFFEQDGTESHVTMTPGGVSLKQATAPAGTPSGFVLPQFPVEFIPCTTIPHSDSNQFASLDLNEADSEAVLNAYGSLVENFRREEHALHQIGGYPEAVQGDVFTECEMIARKHIASTDQKLWKQAAAAADNWRLLLQFDTDGDLKVMWGDAGTIYFCIREGDLRAGRFDHACGTAQCF